MSNPKAVTKTIFRMMVFLIILAACAAAIPRLITALYASSRSYSVSAAPARKAAVVFGAGLRRDGTPSPVLRDRVETAAALYFDGKVEKILMSGDNRFVDYNEPEAMKQYALSLGVPEEAIVLDYAGRRTYDTCYRAKAIFGLDEALLVTQSFHLPRALFTCNFLGLPAAGVEADGGVYSRRSSLYWQIREIPATAAAFWDVLIAKPEPVLGNPEPMFPVGQ